MYGVQGVGLDGRRPYTRLEDMAAHHVDELVRFQPEGPLLLCGYCFSGVLAYEVARQLHERGREPAFLGLVDAYPFGHAPTRTRVELERVKLADFRSRDLRGKIAWIRRRGRGLVGKVATEIRWALYDQLARRGRRVPRALWNMQGAGHRAAFRYVAPAAPWKVTLFRAAQEGRRERAGDISHWRRLAEGGLDVRWIEGDDIRHDNLVREPNVDGSPPRSKPASRTRSPASRPARGGRGDQAPYGLRAGSA